MSFKRKFKAGKFHWSFLLPKYWGIWLAIILLMLFAILPWAIQWRLAEKLSKLAWKTLKSRRKTTIRNLELCFPEKSELQIQADAKQVFLNMMLGLFEALNAWYSPRWFKNRMHIQGLEHLKNAKGKGVLLIGTHTTLLDAGGFVCGYFFDLDVVYRPQNNPLLDMLISRCRATIYQNQISKDDMKGLISNLKHEHAIWYSPDQDFGLKQGVMAPFFSVQAATLTAHRRLIKITKAAAIPLYFYRDGDIRNPQYHVLLEPALGNFPSANEVEDATRVNLVIESQIKMHPTQYMWFHRRFKTRPNGEKSLY
ncbi:lipid A biosynthesis lauroyl acyltransferase [Acinetobacter gyllenbergii]|uniref:Lipid A biosynthesis acyltransferase n=1 Tax=Acinetobacter gyllenbergii CIP 110306 = MTCC 11365 TaxID=1217657 RepID=A0A829HJJ6_9GAMM|nr:lipid A biosynthesis lauroyl acyltransferase [Acinetobacter gyllenbergii]EPF88222.1 lipid A biosynthesis lauroyl acyltransferase [Acinetobacter gyllenbergii CIP 110306 = MTCC 11365]EPH35706.1 Lipid A biosynthesis lauroyl acyltransferase [Acinetobacter gyllenbergii CIP 110306 = MTCC 11365]